MNERYIRKDEVLQEIRRVLNSYHPTEITSGRYALADLRDFIETLEVMQQSKQQWSEEDEKMLNDATGAIAIADYYTYDDKQEIEAWLKSLKQRLL